MRVPEFIALLRKFETPVVFAEHGKYPRSPMSSATVYARLQKGNDELKTPLSAEAARRPSAGPGPMAARPTICRVSKGQARERRATTFAYVSTRSARTAGAMG